MNTGQLQVCRNDRSGRAMMTGRRSLWRLACLCLAVAWSNAAATGAPPGRLTPSDREFLGSLFKKGIPNPRGAKFVRFKMGRWSVWGEVMPAEAVG